MPMPNEVKHDKSIYLDLSTFMNLRENGELLAGVLDEALKSAIIPYNRKISIFTERLNGKGKLAALTEKSWGNARDLLINGELVFIHFIENEYPGYASPSISLHVTCDWKSEEYRASTQYYQTLTVANGICFSLSERLFSNIIPQKVQEWFVKFLKMLLVKLDGVCGYITTRYCAATVSSTLSTLEFLMCINYPTHSHNFVNLARGYFWGNILTNGHIEKLRGIERICNEAPCFKIDPMDFNNKKAVYLQLTEDINNYSDDELRRIKKFLNPVLFEENQENFKSSDPFGHTRKLARLVFDNEDQAKNG